MDAGAPRTTQSEIAQPRSQPVVHSGPVALRLAPRELTIESGVAGDPWTLMDGTATGAFASGGATASVRVLLEGRQLVEAINVLGPARGSLAVRAVVGDREAGAPGLQRVDLSSLAGSWGRFVATRPFEADALILEWIPSDPSSVLPEVEIWGTGEPESAETSQPLADRILLQQGRSDVTAQATPDVVTVSAPAFVREPLAGVLTFQLDADPRTLTRAFLVYELSGVQHWTATSRSINRLGLRSAYRPASGAAGGTQVEEIAPVWLRRGLNQVQFRPVDPNDPVGYRVQHLRVVAFRGAASEGPHGAADSVRQALTDGDPTTGTLAQGRGGDPTWSLGSSGAVHEIDLLVTRPWSGTLDLLSTAAGRTERRRLLSGPTPMGWQRLRLDPPVSAEQAMLNIRGAGEQQGFIAEARLAGGRIREHVDPSLTLTWPVHGECVGREVHVQGYVTLRSGNIADARLYVANNPVDVRLQADGAFAISVPSVRAADLTVEVRMADGRRASRTVAMDDCTEPPAATTGSGLRLGMVTDDPGAPFGQWVRARRAASLSLGGLHLDIPANAVDRDTRITVRPLAPGQLPPLDPGMTNVSPEGKGFRLGPHGTHFARAIHLTLPYDHDRLPRGTTDADVGVYYYNDRTGHWASVTRLAQERGAQVVAASDHFTDFISATLAAPDSPQAASFNPSLSTWV